MKKLISVIIFLLISASCNPVKSGKIVDKKFHQRWVETTTYLQEVSDGIYIPITSSTTHEESYELILQDKIENKVKEGSVKVSKETFDNSKIGDMYGVEQ